MNLFTSIVARRDRARIDKLGTGVGNYISLVLRFAYCIAFVLGGRRHSRFFLAVAHYGLWLKGWKGGRFALVRYLKSCQVTLMQLLSKGPVSDSRSLGGIHGRSRGFIPRVIPVYHRVAIKRGDLSVIRFWISLLGIYRIIKVEGKPAYDTITSPGVEYTHKLAYNLGMFLNHIRKTPTGAVLLKKINLTTELKFSPRAILTSGANVPGGVGAFWAMAWDASILYDSKGRSGLALRDWLVLTHQVHVFELIKLCAKVAHRVDDGLSLLAARVKVGFKDPIIRAMKTFSVLMARKPDGEHGRTKWVRAPFTNFCKRLVLGRVHQIPEPAGKVRVVAMATWWVQVLMYPLHRILYSLLRTIHQDGTYDQGGPLRPLLKEIKRRLTHNGAANVFSFDLKAATDRFPIWWQVEVLTRISDNRRFSEAWRDLLVHHPYFTHGIGVTPRGAALKYGSGQPMGVYSSWAMFSLCHHLLVQQAAHQTGWVGWYPWYALLGDDIVILGETVAARYKVLCSDLGVTIGLAKSLESSNGSFEFAKRFYFRGEDCSPTSIREYWVALSSLPAFAELVGRWKAQNPGLRIADVLRGAKYGYHSVGKLTQRMVTLGNTRIANLLVILTIPGAPFEQPLKTLFSPTASVVHPNEDLVETPKTERRVRSVARTLGDSMVQVSTRARLYLNAMDRYDEHLKGYDPEGILRYVLGKRVGVAKSNIRLIEVFERLGRYLLGGKLRTRSLVTILDRVIPAWKVSTKDVASLPDPFSLDAAGGVLARPIAVRFLKIRCRLLGLPWKGRPRVRKGAGGRRSRKE